MSDAAALAAAIAQDLGLPIAGVRAVLDLIAEGATVPFIARYRKEATGALDEVQIRAIGERRSYRIDLEDRRRTILDSIAQQGALTPELKARIERADTKAELEDLYAPHRPRRRTRAVAARERGLDPLAERMWQQPKGEDPRTMATRFVAPDKEVPDVEAALAGARDINAERIADDAPARRHVREILARHGSFQARKVAAKRKERTKFDDHADREEPFRRIAPHRYLALRRGEAEKVLRVTLRLDDTTPLHDWLAQRAGVKRGSPWGAQLDEAVGDGLQRLMLPRAESELRSELDERADREAVEVFAKNLRDLLLAAPFGERPVVAIDPGQRTGCKAVALDATGKLLAHDTLYLVQGDAKLARAGEALLSLCRRAGAEAVAVGNGTHGRETEAFVRDCLREAGLDLTVVSVNEAGASVYSASDVAREELGEVDVVVRGAVSIGRRLQDPLAELVKIDPASIGVGQYQHDLPPALLATKLDEVVEDCVNAVGVALNNASAPLLARVAGLGPKQARAIVAHREAKGRFRNRRELLAVAGIGPKSFEQAAGFLRIRGGDQPLDASAVHPERYAVVERIARDLGVALQNLVGNTQALRRVDRSRYASEVGRFTLDDILAELDKPGRDPRATFEAPAFRDDVRSLDDLQEGMVLEGVVTNVTDFGAFVDLGVKQDGLVHISKLADRYVKHPSDVVSVGTRLKVRVMGVDRDRKRISLSARDA
ncbi:MAG: Tex family protein [Polyangiaceae bacterium]